MPTDPNPFVSDDHSEAVADSRFEIGIVDTTPEKTTDDIYHCKILTYRHENTQTMRIHAGQHGSQYLPPRGTAVLAREAEGDELVMVKAYYDVDSPIPTVEPGEYHIGHPTTDGYQFFGQKGTVELHSPQKIRNTEITNYKDIWDRSRLRFDKDNRRAQLRSWHLLPDTSIIETEATVTTHPDGTVIIEGEHLENDNVSRVTCNPNGTVEVLAENTDGNTSATITANPNGTVVINGGSKGAIYDITTTKDGDGHVTDITLERRSNILI